MTVEEPLRWRDAQVIVRECEFARPDTSPEASFEASNTEVGRIVVGRGFKPGHWPRHVVLVDCSAFLFDGDRVHAAVGASASHATKCDVSRAAVSRMPRRPRASGREDEGGGHGGCEGQSAVVSFAARRASRRSNLSTSATMRRSAFASDAITRKTSSDMRPLMKARAASMGDVAGG